MSRSPTLAEVIRRAIDARAAELHVALPGKVVRYDAAKQKADVQPLIRNEYRDEAGDLQVESLPVVPDVPVMFPGAGEWAVVFPVNVGDTVLLVFCDASIDTWLARGGEADPLTSAKHTLTDAVCYPGLRPFSAPTTANQTTMVLGKPGGETQQVALAGKVLAELDALKTALASWTPVAGDGGAALKALLTTLIATPWPKPVGSATVKVSL